MNKLSCNERNCWCYTNMRTLIIITILALCFFKGQSQYYYFDCFTSPEQLPFNSSYDSIIEHDSTGWRYTNCFAVALTEYERKEKLKLKRLPINNHRLHYTPNSGFTSFEINGFNRNCYFAQVNPYTTNFAFELNKHSEKGYFNFNNVNTSTALHPLYNMKLEDLLQKLDSSESSKLSSIVKYQFLNSITNYTEFVLDDSIPNTYNTIKSTYIQYESNPKLKLWEMHLDRLRSSRFIKLYAAPHEESRILNKYERTHEVDTAFYDGYPHYITSEHAQIGFKLFTDFKEFKPSEKRENATSPMGFTNNITFIGIVFLNEYRVSETVWIKVADIKKHNEHIGFETQLIELKFLLKRLIEERSKIYLW